MKKRILIVLDGLGDLACKDLKNKTPLEAASTPNLDSLASKGKLGYVYTIKEGVSPESDSATLAILGNDPYKAYTGRGPLEAAGTKIKLGKKFLALRANFATVNTNKILDRRVGRGLTTKEAKILAASINKKVKLPYKFKFLSTIQHRGILVIYNKLSDNISNLDPAYVRKGRLGVATNSNKLVPCKPLNQKHSSKLSASIINDFAFQAAKILASHPINKSRIIKKKLPANYILLRDAGNCLPKLNKPKGKWLAIAGMPLEVGLAKLSGMDTYDFTLPEFSGNDVYINIHQNLNITIKCAVNALKKYWNKYNSFYIHIKETDIPGHDGKSLEKKRIIEILDKKLFSEIAKYKEANILITADHSTPCKLKMHSSHPVPMLLYGKGSDNLPRFTENLSKKGSIGKVYGKEIISLLY